MAQESAEMAKLEPTWRGEVGPSGRVGVKMSQDGQVGAKMEPTWLQDAKDVSTWADIVPI